jgi:hypothetical protein
MHTHTHTHTHAHTHTHTHTHRGSPQFATVCFVIMHNDGYENRRSRILNICINIFKNAQIYILEVM